MKISPAISESSFDTVMWRLSSPQYSLKSISGSKTGQSTSNSNISPAYSTSTVVPSPSAKRTLFLSFSRVSTSWLITSQSGSCCVLLIVSFCPMYIRLASSIPFAAISSLVLIPCSAAISERVSPHSMTTSTKEVMICEPVLRVCLVICDGSRMVSFSASCLKVWISG